MGEHSRDDLLEPVEQKRYASAGHIDGVAVHPLTRHVDDRGLFLELYRKEATHAGSEGLTGYFAGVDVAQLNYSLVTTADHLKGLHLHLKQDDIWFCPPPFKMKVVLWDTRASSKTSGLTQVAVEAPAGDERN